MSHFRTPTSSPFCGVCGHAVPTHFPDCPVLTQEPQQSINPQLAQATQIQPQNSALPDYISNQLHQISRQLTVLNQAAIAILANLDPRSDPKLNRPHHPVNPV